MGIYAPYLPHGFLLGTLPQLEPRCGCIRWRMLSVSGWDGMCSQVYRAAGKSVLITPLVQGARLIRFDEQLSLIVTPNPYRNFRIDEPLPSSESRLLDGACLPPRIFVKPGTRLCWLVGGRQLIQVS
jgi:hypothetical protein